MQAKFVTQFFLLIGLILTTPLIAAKSLIKNGALSHGEVFNFHSAVLKENRDIYISLPDNYEHSVHNYPVVFVLDGEYLFTLANSIIKLQASRNYMPESIVVGIPNNTGNRMHMAMEIYDEQGEPFFYGDGIGQSEKYLQFFKDELIPSLEKKYRINNHRTIIGMSPTFGPVLTSFWSQPNLFRGYIVLAAELSKRLKSGELIADKLLDSMNIKNRLPSAIYVGTSSKDIKKRGEKEKALYETVNKKLKTLNTHPVNYNFEIIADEDHYGMAIKGIHHGLRTIYDKDLWNISYRKFWRSEEPTKLLQETYAKLSEQYGFDVVPVEAAFYSVNNLERTAEIIGRQKRPEELKKWLTMATQYYPHSPKLQSMLKAFPAE